MKVVAHALTVVGAAAVLLGIPFAAFADVDAILSPSADAVSSATVALDAPSGAYSIYLNKEKHRSESVLADWITFFEGREDAPLIMEDISCVTLAGDLAGIDMAESLRSRLSENQMRLVVEDATLALSKAEAGVFDVLVMSEEFADAYSADRLEALGNVEVIHR